MATKRFTSLEEVQTERLRLRIDRDRIQDDLRTHFELLRDPQFRRALAGNAIGDLIQTWKPLRSLKSMFARSPSMAAGALGMLLGAKARTPVGRVVLGIAGTLLPLFLERSSGSNATGGSGHLGKELSTSWERIKRYISERRQHHSDRKHDHD